MKNRIEHLDGLRGLAILLVLFYHLFSRWSDRLPYGDYFSFILFEHGWIGVQLFFLISGFVILMTLERTQTISSFLFKRWLRLFPAMLIASVLIYITSPIFSDRPAGDPTLRSLIPGISFISSAIWNNYLNITMPTLEGVFWSLYVEAYFYLFIAFVYFNLSKNKVTEIVFAIYVSSYVYCHFVANDNVAEDPIRKFIEHIGFLHYGWFAAGTAFYHYVKTKNERWFIAGAFISIFSAITLKNSEIEVILFATLACVIFALSFKLQLLVRILSNKTLTFFGGVSYPLYLIHENASISMVIALGRNFPELPDYLYPIFPIIVVVLAAYVIAKWLEPKFKNLLKNYLGLLKIRFGL